MDILRPLMQLLKFEFIEEIPLVQHSLGTLYQGNDLMKSSSRNLFVGKES